MRRSLALTAGALVLAVPTLSSCGFNYATDHIYTPSAGTDIRTSRVDVLNAVVVASEDNVGAFVATFSNNDAKEADKVTDIAGGVDDPSLASVGMKPITVPPGGYVNLATNHRGITLTGDFKPGDFVTVTIDFATAASVTFLVPVVKDEGPYDGLAPSLTQDAVPS